MDKLLPGIITGRVPTSRLTVNVLSVAGRGDGPAVLFVHGNVSSSLFWPPTTSSSPTRPCMTWPTWVRSA